MKKQKALIKLTMLSLLIGISITSIGDVKLKNYKLEKTSAFCFNDESGEGAYYDGSLDDVVIEEIAYGENKYTQAIDNNKNLVNYQKKEFKQLNEYFSENPYINETNLIYNLENFKVNIVSDEHLKMMKAGAYYDSFSDTICLNKEHYGLTHEGLHMSTDHDFTLLELRNLLKSKRYDIIESCNNEFASTGFYDTEKHIGFGLNEGTTGLLDYEYFGNYNGYNYTSIIVKMLCEITGSDLILKSYTLGDIDLLISKLEYLLGDREEAIDMIEDIDTICLSIKAGDSFVGYENEVLEVADDLNKCNTAISGESIYDDTLLYGYYCQLMGSQYIYIKKGYFSKNYINDIGKPYVLEIMPNTIIPYDEDFEENILKYMTKSKITYVDLSDEINGPVKVK